MKDLFKHIQNTKEATTAPKIPALSANGKIASSTEEKELMLSEKFFPVAEEHQLASNWNFPSNRGSKTDFPPIEQSELLSTASSIAHNSSPGYDEIPMTLIHECWDLLSPRLLRLFNQCLALGYHPRLLKIGKTIALAKPGRRPAKEPKDYRPITMLSTISKIMEKIMTRRITYTLESSNFLPTEQYGFRPFRSCEQASAMLTNAIRFGWSHQMITSVVFLDIRGAYDTVVHTTLLDKLTKTDIPNNALRWIHSFLSDRKVMFSIETGRTTSIPITIGVPQGSALSPILYIVYNFESLTIPRVFNCKSIGFADDIAILTTGRSVQENIKTLIPAVQGIHEIWAVPANQVLADEKSFIIHFTGKLLANVTESNPGEDLNIRSVDPLLPDLKIKATYSTKHLGLTLDAKLSFTEFIEQRIIKANRTVGALTKLGYHHFGISRNMRLQAIKTLVYPLLSFSATSWAPYISRSKMEDLQKPLKRAVAWATGMESSAPASTAFAEAGLLPLQEFLQWKSSVTIARWKTLQHMEGLFRDLTRNWNKTSYGRTLEDLLGKGDFLLKPTMQSAPPQPLNPPWSSKPSNLHLILSETKAEALELWRKTITPTTTLAIYTDGSKGEDGVGSGWYFKENGKVTTGSCKHDPKASVYQAEVIAIAEALKAVPDNYNKVHFFTDSRATVMALSSWNKNTELVIRNVQQQIKLSLLDITIQWIPGHSNIPGNELVDSIAKEACSMEGASLPLYASQQAISADLLQQCREIWKQRWEVIKSQSYLMAELPSPNFTSRLCRDLSLKESSMITQWRSGHTKLNAVLFRFRKVPSNRCYCGQKESAEHVLLHCWLYEDIRSNHRPSILHAIGQRKEAQLSVDILLNCPQTIFQSLHYIRAIMERREHLLQGNF